MFIFCEKRVWIFWLLCDMAVDWSRWTSSWVLQNSKDFFFFHSQVEEYMDTFNYELAHKFCKRALELDPDNIAVLETLGNLLAEQGDTEGAMKISFFVPEWI